MQGMLTRRGIRRSLLEIILILLTTAYMAPSRLVAKEVLIRSAKLQISFLAEESFVPKAFRQRLNQDWADFCGEFGNLFLTGKGPQGRGIFSSVDCVAVEYKGDTEAFEELENSWNFVFAWSKDKFSVTLLFHGKPVNHDAVTNEIGTINFPSQFTPEFLFTYKEASYYVANRIYRRLPFAWSIALDPKEPQWQLPPLGDQMLGIVAPARKLGIFGMAYDLEKNIWIPILYGTAQPIGVEETGKGQKDAGKDTSGMAPYEITWNRLAPRQKLTKLWAQEIFPPIEKEIDPTFITVHMKEQDSGILEAYALEGLHKHQTYLRYGIPFPKGAAVVSQASKVEMNVLLGKGIFDGFNLNFDYSPRVTNDVNGDAYSYAWSRFNIGWSFLLGKPQSINRHATRFKLTPRVGLLNLDAYFPTSTDDSDTVKKAEFHVTRQLDFGGEFAWELESLTYRLKLWGTSNLSGYIFAGNQAVKISSQRAGADFIYDVIRSKGGFQLGLMAFGYIDWVNLQKATTTNYQDEFELLATDSSTQASGASYNVTFLGLGIVFVW